MSRGISKRQTVVLSDLLSKGGMTTYQIAKRYHIQENAAHRMMASLRKRGLVHSERLAVRQRPKYGKRYFRVMRWVAIVAVAIDRQSYLIR